MEPHGTSAAPPPRRGTALDQFRLKAAAVLVALPELSLPGSRISIAAISHAYSVAEDTALCAQGARSPREESLRFLSECLGAARGHPLQARTSLLMALCRAYPASQLFCALEAVLYDRHATRLEVAVVLELLHAFAADAHIMHQQQQVHTQAPFQMQGTRAKGLGSDPLRRHLVAQAARMDKVPQPSAKPPPPPPSPAPSVESSGLDAAKRGYGQLVLSLLTQPVDDGASIRPYEKALAVAFAGQLPSEWLSLPPDALLKAVGSFNTLRASFGEHGALVPAPTERTGLLSALVWRAVDDPEPAIGSAALELLRSVLDVSIAGSSEVPLDDLGRIVQSFYDYFAPWLVQPFCSARLMPPTTVPDPKTVAALVPSTTGGVNRIELARQMCPWFGDSHIGNESSSSKQSKHAVLEHLLATYEPHAFRFKYLQLRNKVFSRVRPRVAPLPLLDHAACASSADAPPPLLPGETPCAGCCSSTSLSDGRRILSQLCDG